jgi:hypothetical protein
MMERLFISILFGGMFASMASGGALDSIDLNAYQWKHRLLFLFVPSEEDPSYLSLKKEIEHQAKEVLDRDLLIAYVLEKGEGRLGMERLSSGQGFSLRKNLSVPPGQFMSILIGKDGGEKFRQDRIVELKEIFRVIDAMPMRQQEMKEK